MIFACLLPPPTQAKRVEIDGEWYEACYGRKYRNHQKNMRRFASGFQRAKRHGLEWHDNDTFAGIREYRTDICTIAAGGQKFLSVMGAVATGLSGVSTPGQDAADQKVWGEGFQLIALRHKGQKDYKIALRFNHVDLQGKPLQGSKVLLAVRGEIVEIDAIPASPEIMRQVTADSVSGGAAGVSGDVALGISRSRTTYDETVWAVGGASFILPPETLESLQASGVRFRIYGEQVPKKSFYLPPEFLRAFLDAIAKFDAENYG